MLIIKRYEIDFSQNIVNITIWDHVYHEDNVKISKDLLAYNHNLRRQLFVSYGNGLELGSEGWIG